MFEVIAGVFFIFWMLLISAFFLQLDGIIEAWKSVKRFARKIAGCKH